MFYKQYEKWLINKINPNHKKEYNKLLHHLHCTPFRWFVPNDDCRESDGKILRDEFCIHYSFRYSKVPETASILEVLIALAERLSWTIGVMNTSQSFWMMLKHLEISSFTDDKYDGNDVVITNILEYFLRRDYDFYGRGGLFPLKNPKEDQRKVEIWYQMNAYILENYY